MLDGDSDFTNTMIRKAARLDWDEVYRKTPQLNALGKNDLVLDVGAHIGDSTLFFEKQGCSVIAFEPQADSFECLKRNCKRSVCLNQPVGNGQLVTLHEQERGNLGARRVYDQNDIQSTIGKDVKIAIRLDSLHLPKVSCIKIDVEGFEPYVLRGAKRILTLDKPIVIVEFNPSALQSHGFRIQDLMDELVCFQLTEIFRYYEQNWDVLCTPV